MMTSPLDDLARKMRGALRLDTASRILYATDASIYRSLPAAVLFPRDEEDIATAVAFAADTGIPILPRGAGTALSGQAITSGIVVDMTRFNSIEVDAESRLARVGPGAIIDAIDRAGKPHCLQYGPSPASANRATIGGLIANNGTGARSIRYGMAKDQVTSLRVLLPTGELRSFVDGDLSHADPLDRAVSEIAQSLHDSSRWPRTWRNASGLDLRGVIARHSLLPLFCGSEGSLGFILEATIRLVERPAKTTMALFYYDSLVAAVSHVPDLLKTNPSAVELMDRRIMELASGVPGLELKLLKEIPEALLIVEYDTAGAAYEARALDAHTILEDAASQAEIWKTRKEGLGILMSSRKKRKPLPFIEDCAVPVDVLPEYVSCLDEIIRNNGTEGAYYAHASAGCLHIRPLLDLRDPIDVTRMNAIMESTVDLVARLGGTLTGEHGDGRSKRPYLRRVFGDELVDAFERVQTLFDPSGIFRPDPGARLRIYQPENRSMNTTLSWESGLAGELDRCNGEAACRKLDGVMCPSYQVTGDELLSTRGRANLLRAWVAGEDVAAAIDETLAKCLGCKACASECPSQVDMASFKAEYLSHRKPTAADRFFSRYDELSRLGRALGNPAPGIARRIAGIDPRRAIPVPARPGFMRQCRDENLVRSTVEDCDAVLFVDTHMEFYEPEIGLAAMRVFDQLGLRVFPMHTGCCGRPAFSRGMLDKARRDYRRLQLPPEKTIIVAEPSCLSMLTEDAPRIAPEAAERAEQFVGLSRFLLGHSEAIRRLPHRERMRILHHGHCHQKAAHLAEDDVHLLSLVGDTSMIDAGCCGMAGSFGYEAANYGLSIAIAEDRFLPALRAGAKDGASISLAGRSCREQAAHAGIRGVHPVVLLEELFPPRTYT